ncbi:MAG: pseudouridine synthase [Opitutales bacterium]
MSTLFISFPPGLLGSEALRIPLLANEAAYFALAKPPGIAAVRDSLHVTRVALLDAIRREISAEKPQFLQQGITAAEAVHWAEPEVSGIFLCAKTHEAKTQLKNAMGALQFTFVYHFFAESRPGLPDEFTCDLPVARHRREARMLISHKTGKKAFTRFRRIEAFGTYGLWESESPYDRPHQVRLHAAESGLSIPGDTLYAPVPNASPSSLPGPLYDHIYLHHRRTFFPFGPGEQKELEMPYPKALQALLGVCRA